MFGIIEGNTSVTTVAPPTPNSKVTFDTTNIIGLIVWMLCILYNCISSAVEVSKINNTEEKRGKFIVSNFFPFSSYLIFNALSSILSETFVAQCIYKNGHIIIIFINTATESPYF